MDGFGFTKEIHEFRSTILIIRNNDSDGCLDKVFWVLKGALGLWIENEKCPIIYDSDYPIIYDTSHGTNKYGLSQTVILA